MKAIKRSHKHFVRFLPEAIESYNKAGRFRVSTKYNPALWSPELATIVDSYDPFFKPGDIVLVMYDVYIRGKNPQLNAYEERRNVLDEDPDIYWAFENEVLGKVLFYNTPLECYVPKPKMYYKKNKLTGMKELDRVEETVFGKPLRRRQDTSGKIIVEPPKMLADFSTYMLTGELGPLRKLEQDVNKLLDEKAAIRNSIIESNFWVELQGSPALAEGNKYALVKKAMFVPLTHKSLLWIEASDIYVLANDLSGFDILTNQHN